MRGSRGARPLRDPLRGPSGLHRVLFCEVAASRCAKAPLGVAHRFAPSRVYKTGITLSGLRWVRSHSRRRFPVVGTPYAPPASSLVWLLWHRGIGQALRAVFWSVACGQSCCVCPRPPSGGLPLRGFGPALVCPRPPPRWAPAVQRKILHAHSKKNAAGASRLRCLDTTPSTPH